MEEGDIIEKPVIANSVTPEDALLDLRFVPQDPSLPLLLATLPHEVLLLILSAVSLSPISLPPSKPKPVEVAPTVKMRGRRPKTIKEELKYWEAELGLEHTGAPWITDITTLERFAATCRMSRILTLESPIWR